MNNLVQNLYFYSSNIKQYEHWEHSTFQNLNSLQLDLYTLLKVILSVILAPSWQTQICTNQLVTSFTQPHLVDVLNVEKFNHPATWQPLISRHYYHLPLKNGMNSSEYLRVGKLNQRYVRTRLLKTTQVLQQIYITAVLQNNTGSYHMT